MMQSSLISEGEFFLVYTSSKVWQDYQVPLPIRHETRQEQLISPIVPIKIQLN